MFAVTQNVVSGSDAVTTITLSAALVVALTGTVIPLITGVIVKLAAPSWVKAVVQLLLSAISGAVVAATKLDGTAVFSKATIITMVSTWLIGIVTYQGFWKPTVAPTINYTTRNLGIGPATPAPPWPAVLHNPPPAP